MALQDSSALDQLPASTLRWSVAIAIACGILVTAYLVYVDQQESYTALYIEPGSYSNYLEGDTISFTYGIQHVGPTRPDYLLEIYLDDQLLKQLEISDMLASKSVEIEVPASQKFPAKVQLVLHADEDEYTTHFWIKGRRQ